MPPRKPDPKVMSKISEVIASPASRKSFAADPLRALERAGIPASKVPKDYVDVLAELSPDELDVLGRVTSKVPDAVKSDTNGYVVF